MIWPRWTSILFYSATEKLPPSLFTCSTPCKSVTLVLEKMQKWTDLNFWKQIYSLFALFAFRLVIHGRLCWRLDPQPELDTLAYTAIARSAESPYATTVSADPSHALPIRVLRRPASESNWSNQHGRSNVYIAVHLSLALNRSGNGANSRIPKCWIVKVCVSIPVAAVTTGTTQGLLGDALAVVSCSTAPQHNEQNLKNQ